jgi:peptide-methionine (S)-S-oxide reductase
MFGLGCFWGAERKFWQTAGVWTTAVGYAGGLTPNPTYAEVCSGKTGHNEVVLVGLRPGPGRLRAPRQVFWDSHDPTQGMRQGNDVGTQYRSGIYVFDAAQRAAASAPGPRSRRAWPPPATGRSPPRSSTRRPSTTPRTITSSTCTRTRAATAGSAAPA